MIPLRDLGIVTTTIPAAPTCVHVLRTVAASVASRVPMSLDDVDDLRLAVDEAAARLVLIPNARNLEMEVAVELDGLAIAISVETDAVSWPESNVEDTLPWKILTSLAERVAFQRVDGRPVIRMFKRVAGSEVRG